MGNDHDKTPRIEAALRERSPGLWPFLPAGYPDLTTTRELLLRMAGLPIRGVELGFPFSDSIADGPVIQRAFSAALASGLRVLDVLKMVAAARSAVPYPILAMVSASIVYRIGVPRFAQQAASAGLDGMIVPDLSLEEAPGFAGHLQEAGLALSMLVAPTTPPDRQRSIAAVTTGFLYYVSVQGTTGERSSLPADLAVRVADLRTATGLPVLVGFGLSRPDQVREVCRVANGAIVGSAIVHRMSAVAALPGSPSVIEPTIALIRDLAQAAI